MKTTLAPLSFVFCLGCIGVLVIVTHQERWDDNNYELIEQQQQAQREELFGMHAWGYGNHDEFAYGPNPKKDPKTVNLLPYDLRKLAAQANCELKLQDSFQRNKKEAETTGKPMKEPEPVNCAQYDVPNIVGYHDNGTPRE